MIMIMCTQLKNDIDEGYLLSRKGSSKFGELGNQLVNLQVCETGNSWQVLFEVQALIVGCACAEAHI